MNIILKTEVTPEVGESKAVAITFNTDSLVNIVKTKGLDAGNQAIDNLVSKYTQDIKKIISEVINK